MTDFKTMLVIIAVFLAAILFAVVVKAAPQTPPQGAPVAPARPYSCRMLDEAEKKCAFGQCDKREMERLRKECLRDGGRP